MPCLSRSCARFQTPKIHFGETFQRHLGLPRRLSFSNVIPRSLADLIHLVPFMCAAQLATRPMDGGARFGVNESLRMLQKTGLRSVKKGSVKKIWLQVNLTRLIKITNRLFVSFTPDICLQAYQMPRITDSCYQIWSVIRSPSDVAVYQSISLCLCGVFAHQSRLW